MSDQRIPAFEGQPVHGTAIQMSGAIPMDDLEGEVIQIDDVAQLVCQFKCVGVQHKVDAKGNLVRVQVLRPLLMTPLAFGIDETNPNDFILRAMPRGEVTADAIEARVQKGPVEVEVAES